jgi:hypothetical protein
MFSKVALSATIATALVLAPATLAKEADDVMLVDEEAVAGRDLLLYKKIKKTKKAKKPKKVYTPVYNHDQGDEGDEGDEGKFLTCLRTTW